MSAPVSVILARKGVGCETIEPDATIGDLARRLSEFEIGALVVSDDGETVAGIITERDLVHALARAEAAALSERVETVMSRPVTTCTPTTSTDEVMAIMTERRVRHVPVVEGDRLVGIVSIGDVVKWRIDELQEDTDRLQDYVRGSY